MTATGLFLTPAITKIELHNKYGELGTATGFFIKLNQQWYLITNWHVLSGRNPRTGRPHHSSNGLPTLCSYYTSKMFENELSWEKHTVALGDVEGNCATWFEHPTLGQHVDIAIMPITKVCEPARDILDPVGHDFNMYIDVGDDLFLPGFPRGFAANDLIPLWKRASLASSLEFGHSRHNYFYVDTASKEGMAGSPCFALSNAKHYSIIDGESKMKLVENPLAWRLIGVYSGKLDPGESFEMQIGKVWKEHLIFETINGQKFGSVKFCDIQSLGIKKDILKAS